MESSIVEVLEDIQDKEETYLEVLDEIIGELKCKDCINLDCRLCRLVILKDLQENIIRICEF